VAARFITTPYDTLNRVVVAPMPSASVTIPGHFHTGRIRWVREARWLRGGAAGSPSF
jgi:hypothetical protein